MNYKPGRRKNDKSNFMDRYGRLLTPILKKFLKDPGPHILMRTLSSIFQAQIESLPTFQQLLELWDLVNLHHTHQLQAPKLPAAGVFRRFKPRRAFSHVAAPLD